MFGSTGSNTFQLTYRSKGISTVSKCATIIDKKNSSVTTPKNCQFLDLSDNCINGVEPSECFQSLTKYIALQTLSLQNNTLRGSWAKHLLPHLPPTLKRLDIGGNNIRKIPWNHLGKIKLLELNLDNNIITSLSLSQTSQTLPLFSSLRSLSISSNKLINFNGIERFINLDALDVRENAISRTSDLLPLASLLKLQALKIVIP